MATPARRGSLNKAIGSVTTRSGQFAKPTKFAPNLNSAPSYSVRGNDSYYKGADGQVAPQDSILDSTNPDPNVPGYSAANQAQANRQAKLNGFRQDIWTNKLTPANNAYNSANEKFANLLNGTSGQQFKYAANPNLPDGVKSNSTFLDGAADMPYSGSYARRQNMSDQYLRAVRLADNNRNKAIENQQSILGRLGRFQGR